MIIVLKPQSTKQMVDNFVDSLQKNYDVKVNEWVGTQSTVLALSAIPRPLILIISPPRILWKASNGTGALQKSQPEIPPG